VTSNRTVVVIGAGIIGLSTAWYARRDGHRVIVLERGARDHDCCSLGNSGLIVPSHIEPLAAPGSTGVALRSLFNPRSPLRLHPRLQPDYLRWCWRFWRSATAAHVERSAPALRDLALLSRSCYEELDSALGSRFELQRRGALVLCRTQHGLDEEAKAAELANRLGIPAHVLDATQTAEIETGMALSVAGSIHYPLDAHLTPQVLVAELTSELERQGVEFRWSTEARGWRRAGPAVRMVETSGGDIEGDEFVIAGGSWSARLARGLDLRIPLEAGKGYNVTLTRPRKRPAMSAILSEARIAVTPMGQSLLRFAGTLELAGLDTSIDMRRVRSITDAIPAYYPEFNPQDFENLTPWSGLRPCSPDGMPYIGRVHRYQNLIVATGHAMMGVSLGPATGRVVSDLLLRRTPSAPLERFDPDRFG
jgi:D-amino-acid dehydrogenase